MFKGFIVKSKLRDYEVHFVNDFSKSLACEIDANAYVIIDQKVARLFSDQLKAILPDERVFPLKATEFNKSIGYCHGIIKLLIRANIRKNSVIIAIGGGIIQDISAFISSILFRGIDWIFFPTTLLAQADSCIGGKTSINVGMYKNLLGNFYPPTKIYIDTGFLETLPAEELKSGIGEILHFYFIEGNKLAEKLMIGYRKMLRSPRKLKKYIMTSLLIKKKVVEVDEFDKDLRNLFNYGHTFGHAIETISKYRINHGQAVTMGMDIANFLSFKLGYIKKPIYDEMHKILSWNLPAFCLKKDKMRDYLKALSKDKKSSNQNLSCILTRGPGAMLKVQVPLNEILEGIISLYFSK